MYGKNVEEKDGAIQTRDGKNPGFFQNEGFGSNSGFDLNCSAFSGSYWFPIKLPVFQ